MNKNSRTILGVALVVLVLVASITGGMMGGGMMGRSFEGLGTMMGGGMLGGGFGGMLLMMLVWAIVIALLVTLFTWVLNQRQRR